jgi:hypothetical protein
MWIKRASKGFALTALSASLLLTGCGGGGGGGGSSSGGETATYQGVEGPLDQAQEPLSEQVFGGLAAPLAGTPLEAPVECLNQVVVTDILDVLDSLAAAIDPASLTDPQAALEAATGNAQLAATELTADLPNLLASLVGAGDCEGGTASGTGNPLAGTDLADLGAGLEAVFANFGDPSEMDLTQLSALFEQLSAAFSDGLTNVPAEITGAPILGGALTTLDVALADLATSVDALTSQDAAGTSSAIATTVQNLLTNVLVNVVPVGFIEEQSGQDGLFSAQIEDAINQLTIQLDSGLATILAPLFDGFATLQAALAGGMTGGTGSGEGLTGTPLDTILAPLADLAASLSAGTGGEGVTGTPLDLLLAPLVSAIEGGGAAACPLADTPLAPACTVVDSLLSALAGGSSEDPLAILQGLVESLLSTLTSLFG